MNEYKVARLTMIDNGNLKAYADVAINDCVMIKGLKVIEGNKGLFVGMSNYMDTNGEYHDRMFPITAEDREALSNSILSSYKDMKNDVIKKEDKSMNISSVKVYMNTREDIPNILGTASITLDNGFAIPGITIMRNNDTGEPFISYPSDKGKDGKYYKIFTPLTKSMSENIENTIMAEYEKILNKLAEKTQSNERNQGKEKQVNNSRSQDYMIQ